MMNSPICLSLPPFCHFPPLDRVLKTTCTSHKTVELGRFIPLSQVVCYTRKSFGIRLESQPCLWLAEVGINRRRHDDLALGQGKVGMAHQRRHRDRHDHLSYRSYTCRHQMRFRRDERSPGSSIFSLTGARHMLREMIVLNYHLP